MSTIFHFIADRYTLTLMRVEHGEALHEVLRRLLRRVAQLGIRPTLLLLERGFYSVDVIRYLQAARYPFLMPVVIRGRKATHPRGPSATRLFAAYKCSAWARYTLTNAHQRRATVSLCIHCRHGRGEVNVGGVRPWSMPCWGLAPKTTAWVFDVYRQRFGIETSYRQVQEAGIKITSRNPTLRLLLVGIALILRNLWVWIHWACLAKPPRGGRQLRLDKLRFTTLLMGLVHLAEQTFGINDSLLAEHVP